MISIVEKRAIKLPGITTLFISFPYNLTLLELMRSLPTKYYHTESKQWEVPLNRLSHILSNIDDLEDVQIEEMLEDEKNYNQIPTDFTFKTAPFNHQIEGVEYGLNNDCWILGDDQGLGKTKQIIDLATIFKQQGKIHHCLIVTGVNNLKWNWNEEVKTHSNEKAYIIGSKYNKKGKLVIGTIKDRIDSLNNIPDDTLFLITNVETIRDNSFRDKLKSLNNIEMMVIDEAHKVKNPSSDQGKNILKLDGFKYKIALTGTLIMNNPLDAYTSLKWLGIEKSNYYTFCSYYCNYGGFGGHQVVGYKNLSDLREMISRHMLRRLKTEVLDLPPKICTIEYVEMNAKQRKLYDNVRLDIIADIDKIMLNPNPMVELLRLRQASGDTSILSSSVNESAKLDRLEQMVEELIAENKKCIIFSNWEQMTLRAKQRFAKYRPAYIAGKDIKDSDIESEKKRFQEDDNCKIIIGTTSKLGTGHTLTAASTVFFLDSPWNKANKTQAEDRAYRIGTKGTVNIITLVCKDSIDERIEELINKKGAMADMLVDGKMSKQNYRELFSFLLSF